MIRNNVGIIAIVGLFAFSMVYVYAIETTVDVPFDSWVNQRCSLTDDGAYMCLWVPSEDATITPPLTEEQTDTVEDTEGQTLEVEIEEELKLTREERDIQRTIDRIEQDLIDRPDAVPNADKQLLILLKRAQDECYFGIEQGAPIQAYALFGIPAGSLYIDDTDFSRHVQLGKIAKLIEACIGWDKYRVSHLGQQYSDINQAGIDATPFVPSAVISENVTNTIEYMQRFISEHDVIEEAEDAAEFMCTKEGKSRGLCGKEFGGVNKGGYVNTTDNPIISKYLAYRASPEDTKGEARYDVKTDSKCYTLASFAKQHELDEDSRRALLIAGGCTV